MAEERPAKMRKLSHDDGGGGDESDLASSATDSPNIVIDGSTPKAVDSHPAEAETTEAPADSQDQDGEGKPISKNQLKKLRKREEWEAGREYRKVKRKQKSKEKKERKRAAWEERRANGDVDDQPTSRKPRNPVRLPITFIFDCGFDDLMMEKEMISLGSQLTRAYSDNSRATYQAHIVVSSWGGKLKERFDTVLNGHYKKWRGMRFLQEDFVETTEKAKGWMADPKTNRLAGVFAKYASQPEIQDGDVLEKDTKPLLEADRTQVAPESTADGPSAPDNTEPTSTEQPDGAQGDEANTNGVDTTPTSATQDGEVIYLSSDSPYVLEELKPNSTYIIGGLVDKNRHKGICHKIATEKGLRTAKLPISDFLEMSSRSVLATNHVNEIMLRWLDCGDWGKAFMQVIPKRKGGKLRENDEGVEDASTPGNEDDDGEEEAGNANRVGQ